MRLIDADELIKNIPNEEMISKYAVAHAPTIDKFEIAKEVLIEAIDNAETVGDVVENIINRPQGEWIDMGDFEQCSVCKGTHLKEFQSYYGKTTWVKTPYCPSCGARMKGADDE